MDITLRPLEYQQCLQLREAKHIKRVVMHCTELPDLKSAREYANKIHYPKSASGNSGHFYIDRDGSVEQWVDPLRVAHHVTDLNNDSIGIELVNLGRYPRWFDSQQQQPSENYPEPQIQALIVLLKQLAVAFPNLHEIAGHQDLDTREVAASDNGQLQVQRKIDPGPLFPWQQLLSAIPLERKQPMSKIKQHWEKRYVGTEPEKLTWYQPRPEQSLNWIMANSTPEQAVLDVGAGASTLTDHLLDAGYSNITLLDLSEESLQESRRRLAQRADQVQWIPADITQWQPTQQYALWHDRAVFHFLTEAKDRAAYKQALHAALQKDGILIMATFAIGGPEKCSGLPIVQYDAESLLAELGQGFELLDNLLEQHPTPAGNNQLFNWCLFRHN